jgi:hypothetical protein
LDLWASSKVANTAPQRGHLKKVVSKATVWNFIFLPFFVYVRGNFIKAIKKSQIIGYFENNPKNYDPFELASG